MHEKGGKGEQRAQAVDAIDLFGESYAKRSKPGLPLAKGEKKKVDRKGARLPARKAGGGGPKSQAVVPKLLPFVGGVKSQLVFVTLNESRIWLWLYAFLRTRDLVRWSCSCKQAFVHCHSGALSLLQPVLRLRASYIHDLDFWSYAIGSILKSKNALVPLDRKTYRPVLNELARNAKIGPISNGQSRSGLTTSFDHLQPRHIGICDAEFPQRHTSSKRNAVPNGSIYCDSLTIGGFMRELRRRTGAHSLGVYGDAESATFRQSRENGNDDFALFLLDHFFLAMIKLVVEKSLGKFIIRKVELLQNVGFQIIHRIWLQIALGWPNEDKAGTGNIYKDDVVDCPSHLSFTVCDHFLWVQ